MEINRTFLTNSRQVEEGRRRWAQARGKGLPEQYSSPSTCWRRLQKWEEEGVWLDIWRAFLGTLDQRGQLDWSGAFAVGNFGPAKKEGLGLAKPSGGKAQSERWSTVKVFLWESTGKPPPRRR